MKPDNLKIATLLCKKLDHLKHHKANFDAIMTDDLPQSQFESQKKYSEDLAKDIKKTQKEIEEL